MTETKSKDAKPQSPTLAVTPDTTTGDCTGLFSITSVSPGATHYDVNFSSSVTGLTYNWIGVYRAGSVNTDPSAGWNWAEGLSGECVISVTPKPGDYIIYYAQDGALGGPIPVARWNT